MTTSTLLPRFDIPEKDKDIKTDKGKEFFKQLGTFAESILKSNSVEVTKMDRQYESYVGKSEADSIKHLVSTYGPKNRGKYVSYKSSKTKFDTIQGEYLEMPLNATVRTINHDATSAKMNQRDLLLGAMHAKEALEKIKEAG